MVLCCCGNKNDPGDDPEDGSGGSESVEARGLVILHFFLIIFLMDFYLLLQRGEPGILLTKCSTAELEEWKNSNMEVRIFILFSIYSLDVCHNLPCC